MATMLPTAAKNGFAKSGAVLEGFCMFSLRLGIVLATSGGGQAAEKGTAPEALRVEVVGQALSATVEDAPLREVLRQVGRQAGLDVGTRGDLGLARPQAFEAVPLEEGIRRLIGDNRVNLMMRYKIEETGQRRLVKVIAFPAGEVPAGLLEQRRMRSDLARIGVPPPPPPPPAH